MSRDALTVFVTSFSSLNPYELDYFCQKLCENYQAIAEATQPSAAAFNPPCVTLALTNTMRLLKIEITQERIKVAENELAIARQQTFTDAQAVLSPARLQELAEHTRRLNETG